MPRPNFGEFESRLLRAGVSVRHIHRATRELNDHFDDLVEEALTDNEDVAAAELKAAQALGDLASIGVQILAQPELRSWAFRFPRTAVVVYPMMCLALLPTVPVIAGMMHAPQLVRWAACMLLGGLVTAAMLLLMQLSITLT